MARSRKAKRVVFSLIGRDTDLGAGMYALLDELVAHFHDEIVEARIVLAWQLSWKPDADGRVTLGMCRKATDLDRELAPYDFIILLRQDFWLNPSVTDHQRRALLDHELCHAAVATNADGDPAYDERRRPIYRIRKHDIEEFACIGERYGCWKSDIERFAQALRRGPQQPALGLRDDTDDAIEVTLTGTGVHVSTTVGDMREAADRLRDP